LADEINPRLPRSCNILAIKGSGESIDLAISFTPTLNPAFDFCATKSIALIAYLQVVETILSKFGGKDKEEQLKVKEFFVFYYSQFFLKAELFNGRSDQ
jgi:hypothetical protein